MLIRISPNQTRKKSNQKNSTAAAANYVSIMQTISGLQPSSSVGPRVGCSMAEHMRGLPALDVTSVGTGSPGPRQQVGAASQGGTLGRVGGGGAGTRLDAQNLLPRM